MSNKPLSFKDFSVVDYTFSHETDPKYDPDGLLSYYARKRRLHLKEDDKEESEKAAPNMQTADDVMKRFANPIGYTK
jgi:hypothetical protein